MNENQRQQKLKKRILRKKKKAYKALVYSRSQKEEEPVSERIERKPINFVSMPAAPEPEPEPFGPEIAPFGPEPRTRVVRTKRSLDEILKEKIKRQFTDMQKHFTLNKNDVLKMVGILVSSEVKLQKISDQIKEIQGTLGSSHRMVQPPQGGLKEGTQSLLSDAHQDQARIVKTSEEKEKLALDKERNVLLKRLIGSSRHGATTGSGYVPEATTGSVGMGGMGGGAVVGVLGGLGAIGGLFGRRGKAGRYLRGRGGSSRGWLGGSGRSRGVFGGRAVRGVGGGRAVRGVGGVMKSGLVGGARGAVGGFAASLITEQLLGTGQDHVKKGGSIAVGAAKNTTDVLATLGTGFATGGVPGAIGAGVYSIGKNLYRAARIIEDITKTNQKTLKVTEHNQEITKKITDNLRERVHASGKTINTIVDTGDIQELGDKQDALKLEMKRNEASIKSYTRQDASLAPQRHPTLFSGPDQPKRAGHIARIHDLMIGGAAERVSKIDKLKAENEALSQEIQLILPLQEALRDAAEGVPGADKRVVEHQAKFDNIQHTPIQLRVREKQLKNVVDPNVKSSSVLVQAKELRLRGAPLSIEHVKHDILQPPMPLRSIGLAKLTEEVRAKSSKGTTVISSPVTNISTHTKESKTVNNGSSSYNKDEWLNRGGVRQGY